MEEENQNSDPQVGQTPDPLPEPQVAPEVQIAPENRVVQEDPALPKSRKKLKIILICVAAFVLVAIIGSVSVYAYYQDKQAKERAAAEALEKAKQKTSDEKVRPSVPDVTWTEPVEVPDLMVFNQAILKQYGIENTYYKVANLKGGGEIYLVKSMNGPGITYYRFKKGPDGKYSFLKAQSDELYPSDQGFLNSTVVVDTQTTYKELEIPEKITLANGAVFKKSYETDLISKIANTSKVADTKNGDLYVSGSNDHLISSMVNRNFYLKLADSTTVQFSLNLDYFNREVGVPAITINKVPVTASYSSNIVSGCGGYDSTILGNFDDAKPSIGVVGSTAGGDEVYGISDVKSPLAQYFYSLYKEANDGKMLNTSDKALKDLPIEKFYKLSPLPIFITKDPLGQYIIFIRSDLKSAGGCGKPVIYLYPEGKTDVNVKVGAEVTVSIPKYKNGWNVTAYPDGTIKENGKVWDYLFWEGQGFGMYPEIKSGFIVKQSELKQTLDSHLTKLGLNKKEKADFIDFWMTKLPKTPYIRLSWLTTADMNNIAPLTINPKPQTLIRVFLDYEGLQKPVTIKPQKLTSVLRKGFTVVEWGGLKTW